MYTDNLGVLYWTNYAKLCQNRKQKNNYQNSETKKKTRYTGGCLGEPQQSFFKVEEVMDNRTTPIIE